MRIGGLGLTGAACLLAALLVWSLGGPLPGDTGTVPGEPAAAAVVPVAPAPAAAGAPAATGIPTAVGLPGSGPIPVQPIGVGPSGTLEPPEVVANAGWWRGGATLGERTGTIVLAGHVDAAAQGAGSFAPLWHARPGQEVRLRATNGRELPYRISGTRVYPRTKALPPSVFDLGGPPKLALVTCAGGFDRGTGHYTDTLVVYAVPA